MINSFKQWEIIIINNNNLQYYAYDNVKHDECKQNWGRVLTGCIKYTTQNNQFCLILFSLVQFLHVHSVSLVLLVHSDLYIADTWNQPGCGN